MSEVGQQGVQEVTGSTSTVSTTTTQWTWTPADNNNNDYDSGTVYRLDTIKDLHTQIRRGWRVHG